VPGVALLPLATGAAFLRYRPYHLDRIIGRTLAYGCSPSCSAGAAGWTTLAGSPTLGSSTGRLRSCGSSVTTPDGHVWYVRRRWAKRQLPWKRRGDHELSSAERDGVPIVADTDELLGPVAEVFAFDAEGGLLLVLALLALAALGVLALIGVVREWVVPFLVANAGWIGAALATMAVLRLLDRLTRPWFIEAESARLFHPARRIWRVHGWWRSRRAVQAVVAAIAEGRIDNERGVVLFTERSTARQRA
jgi:hypothetical protein